METTIEYAGITTQADYKIMAKPLNKDWRDCDDIEVSLSLYLPDEEKVFKGKITLFGVIKK